MNIPLYQVIFTQNPLMMVRKRIVHLTLKLTWLAWFGGKKSNKGVEFLACLERGILYYIDIHYMLSNQCISSVSWQLFKVRVRNHWVSNKYLKVNWPY